MPDKAEMTLLKFRIMRDNAKFEYIYKDLDILDGDIKVLDGNIRILDGHIKELNENIDKLNCRLDLNGVAGGTRKQRKPKSKFKSWK